MVIGSAVAPMLVVPKVLLPVAAAWMVAVCAEVAGVEPPALLAVTVTWSVVPTSVSVAW